MEDQEVGGREVGEEGAPLQGYWLLHKGIYEGCHVEGQEVGGREVGEESAVWEVEGCGGR